MDVSMNDLVLHPLDTLVLNEDDDGGSWLHDSPISDEDRQKSTN